jgi:hypothetical protein
MRRGVPFLVSLVVSVLVASAGIRPATASNPSGSGSRSPNAVLRPVTHRFPLRLLITGDSLPGYLGPALLYDLSRRGPTTGWTEVHDGTGLTRPDVLNWPSVAQRQVRQYHPDAVVVLMGGNDFQNMVVARGRVLVAGTDAWAREYQRRALACMRIWVQSSGAHRVYWLSLPPSRNPVWAYDDGRINAALQAAAKQVPGVEYVNVLGPITNHGHYTDTVLYAGHYLVIREPDGVHLNVTGSNIVADEVAPLIAREWHLSKAKPARKG